MTLTALRKAAGLTQDRLAFLLSVNRLTVSRWERGETEPSATTIRRLAWVLRVSEQDILEAVIRAQQAC